MLAVASALDPRSVRRIWLAILAGTVLWLAGIGLAPWLAGRGASGPARLLYAVYAPVCHQIPGRCFALLGHSLAVCGRCLGIYAGFAAGLLLYPVIRGFSRLSLPGSRIFFVLIAPMGLDGVAGLFGIWQSPIGLRFATGAVWGGLLPYYFVPGLADLVGTRRERAAAKALEKAAAKK
jgi:uncharacterized membrane protein